MSLARKIVKAPSYALGVGKSILQKALKNDLEAQLSLEQQAGLKCVEKGDFEEGITAFLQKREPVFRNK